MAERKCPRCGAELAADAPEGLCPQCLLQVGLQTHSQPPTAPGGAGFTPPGIAELNDLFPQLEFLELLGAGGMGAVYKARQKSLDRIVAVKILPPSVGAEPAFAERFTREARALAKLNHPHIVAVHDFGSVRTTLAPLGDKPGGTATLFYFLMEFVDGINIRQAMRAKQLKPAEALQIVPQICDALQYAHEEGVVHRDIKPENILLDKRGRVKIADFGLAKLLGKTIDDLTLTGTRQIVGTVPYMAPEQIEGSKDIDHRADIYSLGVTFYEMLTGELPLGRFAPPSRKVQIDVRLDDVVLRTLEKEPELRYQHAGDVKIEVETISRTPPGKPFAEVFKDVAGQVYETGKRAAGWVFDKASGIGSATKQQAEAFAAREPAESTPATDRMERWFWPLVVLAILGVFLDIVGRRGFAPLGTIFGVVPLVVVAWMMRGTATGRTAFKAALGLGAVGMVFAAMRSEPEIFVFVVLGVVAYLIVERWWTRRRAPTVPAPEADKPG
jgi:hypothetical protein